MYASTNTRTKPPIQAHAIRIKLISPLNRFEIYELSINCIDNLYSVHILLFLEFWINMINHNSQFLQNIKNGNEGIMSGPSKKIYIFPSNKKSGHLTAQQIIYYLENIG